MKLVSLILASKVVVSAILSDVRFLALRLPLTSISPFICASNDFTLRFCMFPLATVLSLRSCDGQFFSNSG